VVNPVWIKDDLKGVVERIPEGLIELRVSRLWEQFAQSRIHLSSREKALNEFARQDVVGDSKRVRLNRQSRIAAS
jgi:hypothetical protein